MPSKKFIIFVLIVLLAGAGIFWLSKGKILNTENKIVFQKQGGLMPFQQNKENSDWEQVLQKASVYTGINASSSETIDTNPEPISETAKFSQNFLSQYLLAKQMAGGNNLDTAAKDNLVNSLVNSVNSATVVLDYKISDLKISNDNSNEVLKNYGNRIGEIFKSHLNPEPGTEIYTFRDAVKNNDKNKFEELGKSVKNYQELVNDCLNLVAPSAVKDNHLQLVNNLALLKDITSRLQNFPNDPVGSMAGIGQYPEAFVNLAASLAKTDAYFKSKGISFGKGEGWYFIQIQLNEK